MIILYLVMGPVDSFNGPCEPKWVFHIWNSWRSKLKLSQKIPKNLNFQLFKNHKNSRDLNLSPRFENDHFWFHIGSFLTFRPVVKSQNFRIWEKFSKIYWPIFRFQIGNPRWYGSSKKEYGNSRPGRKPLSHWWRC